MNLKYSLNLKDSMATLVGRQHPLLAEAFVRGMDAETSVFAKTRDATIVVKLAITLGNARNLLK